MRTHCHEQHALENHRTGSIYLSSLDILKMISEDPATLNASHRVSMTSSTTESYGQVITPRISVKPPTSEASVPVLDPRASLETIPPVPSSITESSHSTSSHRESIVSSGSPLRTLDSVREQVSQTIALRTIQHAEIVDSTKIGVVLTIAPSTDPLFLRRVASQIKHALLTSSYLFAISTTAPPGADSSVPLLICGSSHEFVARAALLVGSKFVGRLDAASAAQQPDGERWVGFVQGLGTTQYDEVALWDVVRKAARQPMDPLMPPPGSMGIDAILAYARTRLERITPETAYSELRDASSPWPVVLVDIRPEKQRQEEGSIAGAVIVERNVLEWRFDPRCANRLPVANRYDLRVIVFCSEGYTSSLAAASLHDLGLLNATDMIGGYKAWKQAGLPESVDVVATGFTVEDYWSQSRGGDSRRGSSMGMYRWH
ncbi:hypothetical protein BDW22DRAFT_673086 [Trametopsis cervina]|nr:hypothetical protein BDW22DRAFT_673086 [Trametopsis cervina]